MLPVTKGKSAPVAVRLKVMKVEGLMEFAAGGFNFCFVLLPEYLQFGDIDHILTVDMGYQRPGQGHLFAGGSADGAKRHPLNRSPAGKIR